MWAWQRPSQKREGGVWERVPCHCPTARDPLTTSICIGVLKAETWKPSTKMGSGE